MLHDVLRPFLLITLCSFTVTTHAEDDAIRWLERMSHATHSLNYAGTFVYMQDGRLETMQLVHGVDDSGERERMLSLSGPNREVIREHGQVTCYLPENAALTADHPAIPTGFSINLPTHWKQLQEVYDLKVEARARVAGREAVHVAIVPRDGLRYGQNYWIDEEHGLLLRTDVVNEQGKVVEQLEFTSLNVMAETPTELLQPDNQGAALPLQNRESQEVAHNGLSKHWRVTNLPSGFQLELQREHAISDVGGIVEHLVYSDGLASVSVFIETRNDNARGSEGTSQRGSVNAYTRITPSQRITVLGEVPGITVRQIADSIEPLDQLP